MLLGLEAGSGQDAHPAEGAPSYGDRRDGAPPVDELLERVKRERTMSATLSPEVARAGDASDGARGGGEVGGRGGGAPARSSSSSSSSSSGRDETDSPHAAAANGSSATQQLGASLDETTVGSRGQNGAVSGGDAASRPIRSSPDSGDLDAESTQREAFDVFIELKAAPVCTITLLGLD